MSVTSATDPVTAVIDILDNEAGNWTNAYGNPDRIERSENSDPGEKQRDARLTDVSLYVHSPAEGTREKFSADDDAVQTEVVLVECYTNDDGKSNDYISDVVSFTAQYATDNSDQTSWVTIWPESDNDQTAQAFYFSGFAVIAERVRLMRHDDP